MKSVTSRQREVEKIRRLSEHANHRRAFLIAQRLREQWPDNPEVLVLWANLLQLQDEEIGPSLEEAKTALQRAVSLDEQHPMAWNELGQYIFAIEDDAKGACECFTKAVALSKRYLTEALTNQAKALMERDRKAEAIACLLEAYNLNGSGAKRSNGKNGNDILEQMRELAARD